MILASLLFSYFATAVFMAKFYSSSSLQESISISDKNSPINTPWLAQFNHTKFLNQNKKVSLLLDKNIQKVHQPLYQLLTRFGSGTLKLDISIKKDNQQRSSNDWETRISAPCVWVSGQKAHTLTHNDKFVGPPHCFLITTSDISSDDTEWSLQAPSSPVTTPSMNSDPIKSICLSLPMGYRTDFLKRGLNFEHVGLWILSSSERTRRLNAAFCPTDWLTNYRSSLASLLGNSSESLLVTSSEGYKPVQYIHDMLTSTFSILSPQQYSGETNKISFWVRLQETIIAGSIPIVIDSSKGGCIHNWLLNKKTSPIIMLSSWDDVSQQIKQLLEEPKQRWNERQQELRHWYLDTMASWAVSIELFLLQDLVASKRMQMKQDALQRMERLPDILSNRKYDPLPRCLLGPFYGRTNNKVVTIAKMLSLNQHDGRALGLDRPWSNWYREHFDDRQDILLYYHPHGECYEAIEAEEAFGRAGWNLPVLSDLLPRKDFRDKAGAIIKIWPHGENYISVHRRHLEGQCRLHAKCSRVDLKKLTCVQERDDTESDCSVDIRLRACDMELAFVHNPGNLPVVLFTDGQVPALDKTFVHTYNTTDFFVEMWLMAKAHTHYGNPQSTVDHVIYYWRNETRMEPSVCYG
jgi:hypothetical protein